jgi:hypothetical protein
VATDLAHYLTSLTVCQPNLVSSQCEASSVTCVKYRDPSKRNETNRSVIHCRCQFPPILSRTANCLTLTCPCNPETQGYQESPPPAAVFLGEDGQALLAGLSVPHAPPSSVAGLAAAAPHPPDSSARASPPLASAPPAPSSPSLSVSSSKTNLPSSGMRASRKSGTGCLVSRRTLTSPSAKSSSLSL